MARSAFSNTKITKPWAHYVLGNLGANMVDRGSDTVEVVLVLGSWGLTWHGWWQVECGCACSALSANMHDDGDPGTLLLRVRVRRMPNSVEGNK